MDHADILMSARTAFEAGNPVLTEQIARRQLQVGVANFEIWMVLLGLALQSQGKSAEAVEMYAELTRRYPKSGMHWGNLGTALREAARPEDAEAAYCQAIVLDPTHAGHYVNVGLLLAETGNDRSARVAFLQAADLDPESVQARIHGAFACYQCGDHRNAQRLLAEPGFWRRDPDLQMEDHLTLSNVLLMFGSSADAEQVLLDALAVAHAQQVPVIHTRLVAVYERMNRLDEARQISAQLPDPANVNDPKLAQEIANVHARMANRGNDLEDAKVKLEELAEQPQIAAQDEAVLMFSLAKICDKQGDTEEAMRTLEQAHAAQMKHVGKAKGLIVDPGFDPLQPLRPPLSAEQFVRWPVESYPQDAIAEPIFIVGFPRSGTTLLEQMLDATPGLHSMDERDFVQNLVERMQDDGEIYPDQLGEMSAVRCEELRALYRTKVASVVSLAPGERLVDKNPLNMLLLPMLRRLFPQSPIVLALRHPCDVVLSCYMQHFRSPVFVDMCSSLERLSRSYVNAMQFWIEHKQLLQPKVLHLRYERLLADFDGQVREIGDFLGIDDISAMRDFHGHALRKGYIGTPSYDQVIQPLNSGAVGRWRKYEKYFRNALPILQPIIEHWGYAD